MFAKFWKDESGATAIEFGMLAAIVVTMGWAIWQQRHDVIVDTASPAKGVFQRIIEALH